MMAQSEQVFANYFPAQNSLFSNWSDLERVLERRDHASDTGGVS